MPGSNLKTALQQVCNCSHHRLMDLGLQKAFDDNDNIGNAFGAVEDSTEGESYETKSSSTSNTAHSLFCSK
jgi:hypothetical protein